MNRFNTLLAVAEEARAASGRTQVVAVLDARMEEVYWASYEWREDRWTALAAPALAADPMALHKALIAYGYDAEASFEDVLTAFHRRFYPEKFAKGENPGAPDAQTAARLLALMNARA